MQTAISKILKLAVVLHCLAFALPGRPNPDGADQNCCARVRAGLPEALKAVEGEDTVKGYRLGPGGAVLETGSHRVVFRLKSVDPKAALLGISPPNASGRREIIAGWTELEDEEPVFHFQVFAAGPGSRASLRSAFTLNDTPPPARVHFFQPPDARDEPKTVIEITGGATWSTTYLLRPDGPEKLFGANAYDFIDLNRDGVYELVGWWRRPVDIRCQFGIFGLRVYPKIYVRSGQGYRQIWPGPEWAPDDGSVEHAMFKVGRGERPDETLPWGSPLQIMGTFSDLDGDGALELVALTDTLTPDQSPQYLAAYKLEGGSMRLVTRTRVSPPWTAYLLNAESVRGGGSTFVVDMANRAACSGGEDPSDSGSIKALYAFRAGRFERTGTRTNHWLAFKVLSMHSERVRLDVETPDGRGSVVFIPQDKLQGRCGLGANREASKITIHWEDGKTEELRRVQADQVIEIREP